MVNKTLQRILYVEDDLGIQRLVQVALERLGGFQVLLFSSGEEALAELNVINPQLILLDVMMPGMDGPQTLAALRKSEQTADIPVIFITAKAHPEEVSRFIELGAQGVITKPFNPMTLSTEIRNIWAGLQQ